jgi:hypothetical protein
MIAIIEGVAIIAIAVIVLSIAVKLLDMFKGD